MPAPEKPRWDWPRSKDFDRTMQRVLPLAVALVILIAPSAKATGDLICTAIDGSDARVALGIGHLPVLSIFSAEIRARGKLWTYGSGDGAGIPVTPAQAFRDTSRTLVDFTDPNLEQVVAELRIYAASEGPDYLEIGWLRLPGIGLHTLSCVGN